MWLDVNARFAFVVVTAGSVGCHTYTEVVVADDATVDVAASDDGFSFGDASGDWSVPTPPPPDALPPPDVACVLGAGDAATCPLPPSICVNATWLEYFDDGVCEDGGCQFTTALHECDGYCSDGGCYLQHLTAVSAR